MTKTRDHLPGDPTQAERRVRRLRREQAARHVLNSLTAGRDLAVSRAALTKTPRTRPDPVSAEDQALLEARVRPSLLHPALGAASFLAGLGGAFLSPRLVATNEAAWREAVAQLRAEEGEDELEEETGQRLDETSEIEAVDDQEYAPLRGFFSLGARLVLKASERI